MLHSQWSACPPSPPPTTNAGASAGASASAPPAAAAAAAPPAPSSTSSPSVRPARTRARRRDREQRTALSPAQPSPPASSAATPSPAAVRYRASSDDMDHASRSLAALSALSGLAALSIGPAADSPPPPLPQGDRPASPGVPGAPGAHPASQVSPVSIPAQALSPPTPAPSPTPTERRSYRPLHVDDRDGDGPAADVDGEQRKAPSRPPCADAPALSAADFLARFRQLSKAERAAVLTTLAGELQLDEALLVSSKIAPRLKRDFLAELPIELALHCVSFLDDARSLGRAMQVSKTWYHLLQDDRVWKDMHENLMNRSSVPVNHTPCPPPTSGGSMFGRYTPVRRPLQPATYRDKFRDAYLTESNWLTGGRLLTMHASMGDSVVTSLVVNEEYIVIGMANSKIHVFDVATGQYRLSLLGHESGVWALVLVTPRKNGARGTSQTTRGDSSSPRSNLTAAMRSNPSTATGQARPRPDRARRMRSSDVCGSAEGWGLKRTLVVSGGCDREVRVWDIVTGECVHALRGHSSTIRCLKVLDGRPVAITGSRDYTLRVWDIDRGRLLRVLEGHEQSVRCVEVAGNQAVSGSYDYTCRLWDVDTGECLQIFEGHYHQIYAVAFDGERVVSGSLDSTVRVWDALSGECLAVLQGHTSLVGQLQLSGDRLITGGSDGRVIVFDLTDYSCVHRLCAHDNSVTCLQFDDRFIVSGGNDGRVKLWDIRTGAIIRELTPPCDAVWRVCFRDDRCAILCQRNGKTVLEVLGFRPQDEVLKLAPQRSPDW